MEVTIIRFPALICLSLGLLAPALLGCAKNQPATINTPIVDESTPWFCQTGEDSGEWDCIRNEELANNPSPTRAPPREVAGSEEDRPTFISRPGLADDVRAQIAPAPAPPAADPVEEPQIEAPAEPPTTNAQIRNDQTLPKHVRLAYQPKQAVSLMDLPDDFYAVQLIALSGKENLENFAKEQKIKGMSAAEVLSDDKLMYVLLLGIYETRALAEEASSDLGPPFESPWIRSMGSLKKAMSAAEAFNQ